MRILFVSRWFPFPPNNGSKIRIWNLIQQLSRCHQIDLVAFADSDEADQEALAKLRSYCHSVTTVPKPTYEPNRLRAAMGYFSPLPRSVISTDSSEMRTAIARILTNNNIDIVLASQIETAAYALVNINILKLIDEVELAAYVDTLKAKRTALGYFRFWLTAAKQYRYVARLVRQFDGCTTVSIREKNELLHLVPGYPSIEIIPNGVDVQAHNEGFGEPLPATLVYCGALTFFANLDAMGYFLREIYPLILSEVPQTKLRITGRTNGVPLHRLPLEEPMLRSSVIFTGYLDDVRPTVARSWVSIIPLRIGGGTRVKLLESLALGTPVVSTSKGAEGLDLVPGRDILVADHPADFAAAVLSILRDDNLRKVLSRNGRQAVAAKYDWNAIGQSLRDFIDSKIASRSGAA